MLHGTGGYDETYAVYTNTGEKMNISEIEDVLISTIEGLNLFKYVGSLGRKGQPSALNYPCAFAYFAGCENTRSKPRPVYIMNYEILIVCKNLSLNTEKDAARDAYVLLEAVEQAINGKRLGITDIEPWTCVSIELGDYESGVITYVMKFQTRNYLDMPIPN